jgi:SWI/SNF-related matrix-associated actin-dependent regulator of chromatin subfamily A member 5
VRIEEGEAKRNKRENLESLLQKKIDSVRYPMQELELNYPTTKGMVYSEEEDRYLLCRLFYYGMQADDVYERIRILANSRSSVSIGSLKVDFPRNSSAAAILTLLGMIEKEEELRQTEEAKLKPTKGKVCVLIWKWILCSV